MGEVGVQYRGPITVNLQALIAERRREWRKDWRQKTNDAGDDELEDDEYVLMMI